MKRKVIVLMSLLVIVLSTGITYAWLSWTSSNTNVTFTINGVTVTYDAGSTITKNLIPTASRTNTGNIIKEITVSADREMYFTLNLDLTSLPDALTETSFKWQIYNSSNVLLNYGNFENVVQGDTITLLKSTTTAPETYTLYIWIDGTITNPNTMQSQTFLFNLNAEANDIPTDVPSGYTRVEYIESTGTQYINTEYGFLPTDKISAVVKMTELTTAQDKYFVTASTWNNNGNRFALGGFFEGIFTFGYGNISTGGTKFAPLTVVDNYVHTYTYEDYVFSMLDLGLSQDVSNISFGGETTYLRLFYGYNAPTKCQIYSYTHKKNDVLVRNMVPAIRNSDLKAGMYDTVNGVFYVNAGSGTFMYG